MNAYDRHRIATALRSYADTLANIMRSNATVYTKREEIETERQACKTLADRIETAKEGCIVCDMNAGGGVPLCSDHSGSAIIEHSQKRKINAMIDRSRFDSGD